MILLVTAAMLVAAMMAFTAGPALAQADACRSWLWDDDFQGYWAWNGCSGAWEWWGNVFQDSGQESDSGVITQSFNIS